MGYANYKDIETAIRNRAPFIGNSARGELGRDENGYFYAVYSYRTKVAEMRQNGVVFIDERRYSSTTSRLQNIVRRAWLP